MKSDLKFALVGCGHIAARHAEHIDRLARLAAVCDVKGERARGLAARYGCRAYEDLSEMLRAERDADVVSVCTPNGLHAEHTITALRAGRHVLCEKPMAISTADGRKMIAEMEAAGRQIFVVKQNRFNPPVVALKSAIEAGRLGAITSVQLNCFWNRDAAYYRTSDWKGRIDLDGGTLYTQFSHFIDLLYWLVGDVAKAQAWMGNFQHKGTIEFEDDGVVLLEFRSGALGSIHFTINSFAGNFEGSITVFGERGTVKVGGQYLNALEYQRIEDFEIRDIPLSRPANDYGFYKGSMSNHDKVYENLIAVLSGNGKAATSAYEGIKTIEIIEMIYASAGRARG